MPDELSAIKRRISVRLRALEAEREALQAALAALEGIPEGSATTSQVDLKPRARRGENLRKVLPLVEANPDLSPKDIESLTGINARVVAATLSKLRRDGRLPRRGDRPADH